MRSLTQRAAPHAAPRLGSVRPFEAASTSPAPRAGAHRFGSYSLAQPAVAAHRAPASGPRLSAAAVTTHAPPIQPAWEKVSIGGKVRNLNLRANSDGTWTYSKTGDVFHDTGAKHGGQRLLHRKSGTTGPLPSSSTHNPKNVLFKVNDQGKVVYLGNTPQNRSKYAGQFLEMDPEEFAHFKSGGKRTPSQKIMDPVSLDRYYFDSKTNKFHVWDRSSSSSGKGSPVGGQLNKSLLARLSNNELVDRRREDRTGLGLQPFDVGTYKSSVSVPQQVDKLSGISAWTTKGTDVNRDHIPSGQSLKNRDSTTAYNQGFTIAIPNPGQHRVFSPTYGGKQKSTDTFEGQKRKRVSIDTDYPQVAVYRDVTHMLRNTRGKNYPSHKMLDLTKRSHRHRQLGAYRKLVRNNVKINKHISKKRGFNPGSQGYTVKPDSTGKYFTYKKKTGSTQGAMMARFFMRELSDHQKIKFI